MATALFMNLKTRCNKKTMRKQEIIEIQPDGKEA